VADGALTTRPSAPRLPVALRVALVYFAARLVTTSFLGLAAGLSGPGSRFGEGATIGSFLMGWDAQWYWLIALEGYPAELPRDDAGVVAENGWAFMPVYPFLARALGTLAGQYPVGAVLVSLVAGYLACLVLHALLRTRLDEPATMWAVVFFAAGPLAALFQVGYAESLFLALLFLALWCVQRRRFAWLYPLIPVLGFTRPGVLAFALFLGLYGIHRWLRRREDPLPARQIVHVVALGGLAVVVGFAWQVIAGLVTGEPTAYLETELAWRRAWLGAEHAFVPFAGFLDAVPVWFGAWGLPVFLGYALLAAVVVGAGWLLLRQRHVRMLGVEVRLWSASYLLYLLAVFFPQSSIFRLLVPLSPLYGALAAPRALWWRLGVLVASLAGQWWWIQSMYALGNTYFRIP